MKTKTKPETKTDLVQLPPWPDRSDVASRLAIVHSRKRMEVEALATTTEGIFCRTEGDRAGIITMLGVVKRERDQLEQDRKESKGPFLRIGQAIDAFFNPLVDRLDKAKKIASDRVTAWQREEAARREQDLEKQRAAEQRAAARGVIVKPKEAPPQVERRVVSESGVTSTTTSRWKHRITNPDLVPRELCVPSDQLIRARMLADVKILGAPREVAGVDFYQDESLSIGSGR